MSSIPDSYLTIAKPAEGLYKDKGSKFISWAYPVKDLEEIKSYLTSLKEAHPKARHICYAYKEGSLQAFAASDIVEIERMDFFQIQFSYPHMNEVMKIIKKYPIQIVGQEVNNDCLYNLSFPQRIAKDVRVLCSWVILGPIHSQ